jgi:hypothetical protein
LSDTVRSGAGNDQIGANSFSAPDYRLMGRIVRVGVLGNLHTTQVRHPCKLPQAMLRGTQLGQSQLSSRAGGKGCGCAIGSNWNINRVE